METACIKTRKNEAIYHVATNNIFLKPGTTCITKTDHGIDIGKILSKSTAQKLADSEPQGELIRKATKDDFAVLPEIEKIEKKAFKLCREKSKEKNLEMKLISVKCLFDKTKVIFYFVAENRIDFRELVRDLAAVFRTRIEMRQIGVRDESRITGGYGCCGQQLCCTKMKGVFAPVSIKMAKEQNLNLNSLKISGICGRLLCCLGYEYDIYKELNEELPAPGTEICIGDSFVIVESVDTLKQTVQLMYHNHRINVHKNDLSYSGDQYRISQEVMNRIENHMVDDADDDFYFDFEENSTNKKHT
jgi:cell fate regulator YaaT (PSP1 superfamily)